MKSETMMLLSVMMDINLEYNTVGGHVKRGGSLPNFIQNSGGNFKINGGNVTSRRGSRRRDGASIVATSLQCRSHGIGPLDRRWRRHVCQSEPRLLTRRSTPSLAGVNELRSGEADVDDGRVVNTVWTANIDNKLYVWTIPCLCLWWSSTLSVNDMKQRFKELLSNIHVSSGRKTAIYQYILSV